jgi:cupin 2 domain-containing protein
MKIGNIFSNLPRPIPDEIFEEIISSKTCKIERIISKGQASPEGFWYDQEQNEWVVVLKGQAALKFQDNEKVIEMGPGDYVNIPAHCKHRVEWTDPHTETIWLAIHY